MRSFQLFMFDFDGLLVDTERGHFEAYRRMCERRGVKLWWDFPAYCSIAHYSSDGIELRMRQDFPELFDGGADWKALYMEKTQAITELFYEGAIQLMPGVEEFLAGLEGMDALRCVVTHSPLDIVDVLRRQHKILNTIPHWITRRDYHHPKPDPECYRIAMKRLLPVGGRAIGFEDSIRGLTALMGSGAQSVLVTTMAYPEIPEMVSRGVVHVKSLNDKYLHQYLLGA